LIREFEANKIDLGALTLTDVLVRRANFAEVRAGRRATFIGTLGLQALARMDFIVYPNRGVAYLRPNPPLVLANPAFEFAAANTTDKIGHWTLADNVQLNGNSLLAFLAFASGLAKGKQYDYNGAIAEFNRVLELDPKNTRAYIFRGKAKFKQDDYDGAITDHTHALELDSGQIDAYLGRSMARKQKSDFAGALTDLDRARDLGASLVRLFLLRWLIKCKQIRNAGSAK
jgi:tetratricopeptide (TPR) repeat protein